MNDYKSNFYRHMHIGMSGIMKLFLIRLNDLIVIKTNHLLMDGLIDLQLQMYKEFLQFHEFYSFESL